MRRQAENFLRYMLAASLMLALVLSPNAWTASHKPDAAAAAAAQYQADIAAHGHSHADPVDLAAYLSQIFHGHAHDVADHDHNTAFLPPRAAVGMPLPDRSRRALASARLKQGHAAGLERPPRG